jgi:hypothetical protein
MGLLVMGLWVGGYELWVTGLWVVGYELWVMGYGLFVMGYGLWVRVLLTPVDRRRYWLVQHHVFR